MYLASKEIPNACCRRLSWGRGQPATSGWLRRCSWDSFRGAASQIASRLAVCNAAPLITPKPSQSWGSSKSQRSIRSLFGFGVLCAGWRLVSLGGPRGYVCLAALVCRSLPSTWAHGLSVRAGRRTAPANSLARTDATAMRTMARDFFTRLGQCELPCFT